MRKIILLFYILSVSLILPAQSWISSNRLVGNQDVVVIRSTIDSENSIYTLGFFTGTLMPPNGEVINALGSRDYFLIKYLQSGEVDWIRHLGGPSLEYVDGGICIDPDDHIYITGGYRNYLKYAPGDSIISTGGFDAFAAKYAPDGNLVWIRNYGRGTANQRPSNMGIDTNGDLIIAGFFTDSIAFYNDTTIYSRDGYDDYFYAKFKSENGNFVWAKQIKGISSPLYGIITNIETTDQSYYFSGYFSDSIVIDNDTIASEGELYDIHLIKTDTAGTSQWVRTIVGDNYEYSYSLSLDASENIYLSGYYESDTLIIESGDTETMEFTGNKGGSDILIAKYRPSGTLEWFKAVGGKGTDKLFDSKFFNNELKLSGHFADTLSWGGIQLTTKGPSDVDMFFGSMDPEGNYRTANSYFGRSNSWEEARDLFYDSNNLYTVMRSNSDLLVLGDSIYTSTTGKYYAVMGVLGCLPIAVDTAFTVDVNGCYGDCNGKISLLASGGFGSPYKYSIDNGLSYQENNPNFLNLCAGDYPVVVIDQENCTQIGPVVRITQPAELTYSIVAQKDPLCHGEATGSITVSASGGTPIYTYVIDKAYVNSGPVTASDLPAGEYLIHVNDIEGCSPEDTTIILGQPGLLEILEIDFDVLGSGTITVKSVSGGTRPYSYILNEGTPQSDSIFTDVQPAEAYVIQVMDANGCLSNEVTGIKAALLSQFSLYPNPTKGMVTIEMTYDEPELDLEILSITGQVVFRKKGFTSGGIYNESFDLTHIGSGMYLLRVDGRILNTKLMIE
ncbi:MAG: T9SS type A sorting domain-containing protein [Bacteroidales bacterium]|nr:T9SS type A sorting domain-containing protein [Bacteroidales bacterium]MBN2698688.1 T9SS type A sorting domain-containing protein [Bacteroidales bacterium]